MLLAYAGWDRDRWAFLLMCNFFLVVWVSLADRRAVELSASAIVVLVTAVLLLGHFPIAYFDSYKPREIGLRAARRDFVRQIASGSLFQIPTW